MKLAEQNIISGLLTLEDTDFVYDFLSPQMFEDGLLGKMYFLLREAFESKQKQEVASFQQ